MHHFIESASEEWRQSDSKREDVQHLTNAGEWGGFASQSSADQKWHDSFCQYLQKVTNHFHGPQFACSVPVEHVSMYTL